MEIMGVKKRTGSKTDSKFRVIPSKSKIRKGFMAIELSYQIGVILGGRTYPSERVFKKATMASSSASVNPKVTQFIRIDVFRDFGWRPVFNITSIIKMDHFF